MSSHVAGRSLDFETRFNLFTATWNEIPSSMVIILTSVFFLVDMYCFLGSFF